MNEFIKDLGLLINAMLIATPPLLYAALGSCISERSGVVNIGIEGMMTVGAFTGAALCYFVPGAPWLAFVLAGVAGALVAVIHAFACITCNADQTISGTAINFLAPGIAIFICRVLFADSTDTPAITDDASRLPKLLDGVFPAGSFWNNVLNIHVAGYICFICVAVVWFLFYKTKFGLRLMACGEHPQAADSVGINVYKMRWAGVLISGVFGGLGGICYILSGVSEWKFENGVAGFGFLALAVMIFGQWKPTKIAPAALLFGMFRALSNVYFGFDFLMKMNIPGSVYNMMPYIISLVILAFTSKKSRAPKAEGIPYDKGQR